MSKTGAPNPSGAPPQAYSGPPPGGSSPYAPQGYPQAYPGAYGYPGYPPPPGSQYPPPPGQYPPPPGQYQPPPGQYQPPPPGYYPSATGVPPAGQYPPSTGLPPVGQFPVAPPAGQHPPPPGAPTAPYQIPGAVPGFPGAGAIASQSPYQAGYFPPPPVARQPLWYLGTAIPDPYAPPAPHGVQKVPGYDPTLTLGSVVKAINSSNEAQCQPITSFFLVITCTYDRSPRSFYN